MLELHIPQLDEESKNVKDLVFSILTNDYPLSIMELTNRIKKHYNLSITYQGVRKAVEALCEQDVLVKKDKKYAIDKKWILELKSYFDTLLTNYESGKQTAAFSQELAKENYAVYTFSNLLELDNFWGKIMLYWAKHTQDGKKFYSTYYYSFWFLINLGAETALFHEFNKHHVKSFMIVCDDAPLSKWGGNIYKEYGAKIIIDSKQKKEEHIDVNILGDMVLQVVYPKEITQRLERFYRKYKSVQEMSLKDITELAHYPAEIKMVLFKNPMMADGLRKQQKLLFGQKQ